MQLKKSLKDAVSEELGVTPISENQTDTKEVASVDRLNSAIDLMCRKFGVDEEYVLTAFADKGSSIKITMSSADFEVACTIKNPDLYGFESVV